MLLIIVSLGCVNFRKKMLPSVGIFGTDSSAKVMILIFRSVGFSVSGIWAGTEEKAKTTAAEMEIPFHTSKLDELLLHSNVDIVCVCGSPHLYAEVAVKALSIGKHVFCSAPAGLSLRDAEKMISAAQYYPQLISLMNHPLRFLKSFIKARDLIADGYCGQLLVCECTVHTEKMLETKYDWHCDQAMGGGILHTYGCHVIDILSFLVRERACKAQGILETFVKHTDNMPGFRQITSDDFCSFSLKFQSGLHASVTLNSHMPGHFHHEIAIVGTKGYIRLTNGNLCGGARGPDSSQNYVLNDSQTHVELPRDLENSQPKIYFQGLESLVEGIKSAFQSTQNTDRRNADHNLIAAAANFEDGCYVRAVMDAIIHSNKKGQWVRIASSAKNEDGSPFWSSTESSHQKLQQIGIQIADARKTIESDVAKVSPKYLKRERIK